MYGFVGLVVRFLRNAAGAARRFVIDLIATRALDVISRGVGIHRHGVAHRLLAVGGNIFHHPLDIIASCIANMHAAISRTLERSVGRDVVTHLRVCRSRGAGVFHGEGIGDGARAPRDLRAGSWTGRAVHRRRHAREGLGIDDGMIDVALHKPRRVARRRLVVPSVLVAGPEGNVVRGAGDCEAEGQGGLPACRHSNIFPTDAIIPALAGAIHAGSRPAAAAPFHALRIAGCAFGKIDACCGF